MLDTNIIAKNIVALRKQRGLKQQDLADKIHYSNKVISKWERGESIPDVFALTALADFFGISLDEITKEMNVEQTDEAFDEAVSELSAHISSDYDNASIDENSSRSIGRTKTSQIPSRKKKLALLAAIILAVVIFPIIFYALDQKHYSFGDEIKTKWAAFQVNSVVYSQSIAYFPAVSGMTYVIIDIEITNKHHLELILRKENFQYSNSLLASSNMQSRLDSFYSTNFLFFRSVIDVEFNVSLAPDSTRKGLMIFLSPDDDLSNQKLTYTERQNESKTNTYVVKLPPRTK